MSNLKIKSNQRITVKQRFILRMLVAAGCLTLVAGISIFMAGNFGSSTATIGAPGKHGVKTISSGTVKLNEYTTLSTNANAGTTSISVASHNMNTNSRFSGNLSSGELIMIIQMQGATITTVDNNTYGTISAYNNSGKYEFAEVSSTGGGKINLSTGLKYSYTAADKVQIVRVPRYSSLTLNSGATITTDAWDGSSGGIIAIEVSGTSTINGTIDVSSLGFRGGQVEQNTSTGITSYRSTSANDGAEKGESIAGYQGSYSNGRYGRGAPANGGGGGNAHNGGGGGGANGGATGSWNGGGNPDISNSNYITAWNLEGGSFANNTSSGGGRGGYGWGNSAQNPVTLAPGNASWSGDNRPNVGGFGGRPLDYSGGRIFMGGGGGAGDSNNGNGTAGGEGGGIIYFLAGGNVTGTGSILANGENVAVMGTSGNGDAAGGGGGGGTVIFYLKNATLSNLNIQAKGGNGGDHNIAVGNYPESEGPGGGGSGGYVALSNSTGVTINVNGGLSGLSNSTVFTNFAPNGATRGGTGINNGTTPLNPYSGTSTLPVELISFTATTIEKQVMLKWITASEKNNDYFTLERSSSNKEFIAIAKIDGIGNSSAKNEYHFIDKYPLNENCYYRLRQTDFNGQNEIFTPIPFSFPTSANKLKINNIFPNPFIDQFDVVLTNNDAAQVTITVFTLTGQVISKEIFNADAGSYLYHFKCPDTMFPGMYLLSCTAENNKPVIVKIQKQ
jgi:hypothetical protein